MYKEASKAKKIKYLEENLTQELWNEFSGSTNVKLYKSSIKEFDALTIETLVSRCLSEGASDKSLSENTLIVQGGDVLTSNAKLNSFVIYRIIDIDENSTYHAQLEFDEPYVKDADWEEVTGFTKVLTDSNELSNDDAKRVFKDLSSAEKMYKKAPQSSDRWEDGVAFGIKFAVSSIKHASVATEKPKEVGRGR